MSGFFYDPVCRFALHDHVCCLPVITIFPKKRPKSTDKARVMLSTFVLPVGVRLSQSSFCVIWQTCQTTVFAGFLFLDHQVHFLAVHVSRPGPQFAWQRGTPAQRGRWLTNVCVLNHHRQTAVDTIRVSDSEQHQVLTRRRQNQK